MRLETEGAPYPLHCRDRQSAGPRHAARTPVGGVSGHRLEGANDHCLDPGILDGARRPRSRLVPKTFKPVLGEAPTPLAHRVGINSQTGRHDLALLTFS